MTAALERAIRAGCEKVDRAISGKCKWPECDCPEGSVAEASIAALTALPSRSGTAALEKATLVGCEALTMEWALNGYSDDPQHIAAVVVKAALAAALADDETTIEAVCASDLLEDETAWTPKAERVQRVLAALRRHILGEP